MKTLKKSLAVLLSVLMLVSAFGVSAFAADYTIELGETITVTIPAEGYAECKFTPEADGKYVVYSDMGEADIDPYVYVYDKDGNEIADDDDNDYADTYDFYCIFEAQAGADYSFEMAAYDDDAVEFDVTVSVFGEITHQPTADDPCVEVSEGADAEYQWYKIGDSLAELTDEYATPRGDYRYAGNFATYDSENGWTGVYTGYDEGSYKEHNFFGVILLKGQTIKMTADTDAVELGIWCICEESDEVWEDVNANDTVEFTADHACVYNTWGVYEQEPHLKAEMPEMTKVNTDAELKAKEAGTYICVVTFDGCRPEISDEVEMSESDIIADKEKITKADINIRTDIAGMDVNDYEDYIEILTEGLQFEDNYGDPGVFVYDITSGDEEEAYSFENGRTYKIYVYLAPESGYKFANTVDGTVNGEETVTDIDYWEPGGEYGDIRVDYVELIVEITVNGEPPECEHSYTDGNDATCDLCDADRTQDCDCKCHKGGIEGFFFKFFLFFQKIFGMNKVCGCGMNHNVFGNLW